MEGIRLHPFSSKQPAVVAGQRMPRRRRAAPEIANGFDQGIEEPALEKESSQESGKDQEKGNLVHGFFLRVMDRR